MKTNKNTVFETPKSVSWLWPDRTIGKRESRVLREEHNALANSHHELLTALKALADEVWTHNGQQEHLRNVIMSVDDARAAIKNAEALKS